MKKYFWRSIGFAVLASLSAQSGFAADAFPARPIRILVNTAPGGLTDVLARVLAPRLAHRFGQPFVVENRTGASGIIAAEAVARG